MPKQPGKDTTVGRVLKEAVELLEKAGVASPRVDAEIMTADVMNIERHKLAVQIETRLDENQLKQLVTMVNRRREREPLQLILGWAPFLDLKIGVVPGVFIPRPETEGLAELCLTLLNGNEQPVIIETCAGTGAVSLWLKSKIHKARVIAVEKYSAPVNCMLANANLLGYDIEIMNGNLLEPAIQQGFRGKVDLVIANPPYISSIEMPLLPPEIIEWEARSALHGGLCGTDFYPLIIDSAAVLLRSNGFLAFEIGENQGEEISNRVDETGLFDEPVISPDLSGRPRYLHCKRNGYLPRQVGR